MLQGNLKLSTAPAAPRKLKGLTSCGLDLRVKSKTGDTPARCVRRYTSLPVTPRLPPPVTGVSPPPRSVSPLGLPQQFGTTAEGAATDGHGGIAAPFAAVAAAFAAATITSAMALDD